MKLLMISGDRWILAGKRGAFWYTLEEFRKHWERIDVICPSPPGPLSSGEGENQVFENVRFHPSVKGLASQPSWILQKGTELIREHRHNVMTVHEYPPFYNGIGARKLSKATGVPHVLEIHHIIGYPVAASLTETIGRMMSRWSLPGAIRTAAATRTVNASTKDLLVQWGAPGEKIHVVPSFYLNAELLRPMQAEKKYDLVFCARLVANKGLSSVLHALQSLPGSTMLVIGDGPERGSNEALARQLGLIDRVTFVGWLPTQEDVVKAMQTAKIFVMNSLSEGGPRVALEAMACGLPVISTKVGVMPDVIRDGQNGLFTAGTPDDLILKIKRLLADKAQREAIGKEASRIIDGFERKRLTKEYAAFLQVVCAS